MNRRAVGYQIHATRQKPDTKEPKRYPSHLLDEISRMNILDFVEDEEEIMDCLGSEGEQSMDDDELSGS
jgi:hypothetical protein